MVNFSDLKKNRKVGFQKLQKDMENLSKPGNRYKDERFYKPNVDAAGNTTVLMRLVS